MAGTGRPYVVVIDGIIGAGKSTLISKCLLPEMKRRGLSVTLVTEPVEKWKSSGALEQFYAAPARRAYQFQTRVFHDRIKEMQKQWESNGTTSAIFILERSIFTDRIFMDMLFEAEQVDETEYRDYNELWTMWSKLMPCEPDLFIYLRPSLDATMARVAKRARVGEGSVSRTYQQGLLDKHDDFLSPDGATIGARKVPVYPLDTDDNFADEPDIQRSVASNLVEIIMRTLGLADAKGGHKGPAGTKGVTTLPKSPTYLGPACGDIAAGHKGPAGTKGVSCP